MPTQRTVAAGDRSRLARALHGLLTMIVLGCTGTPGSPAAADDSSGVGSSVGTSSPSSDGESSTTRDDGTRGDGSSDAAGSSGVDAGSDGSTGGPPPMVDPCADQAPVCPTRSDAAEHGGLVEIDRCGFPLDDESTDASADAIVQSLAQTLPVVGFDDLVGDLNRDVTVVAGVPGSPAGLSYGFRWDASENDKPYWIPQGISGSADASDTGLVAGRRLLAVSWYYDIDQHPGSNGEKGVRISWVDVTDPDAPSYRMALLVQPTGTPEAPSFGPVTIHAGGIAWVGDRLWVADTGHGFRVFDLTRMMQVATDEDIVGCAGAVCHAGLYKYIVPQIGRAEHDSSCGPRFSFVALDRSDDELALVSGEYCSDTACDGPLTGRLFRWPLADDGTQLRDTRVWPTAAWLMGQRQVQGAAWFEGVAYLSSSAPAGGAGELYRAAPGASGRSNWSDAPEDLMIDASAGWLWGLSEAEGARYVYAAELEALPPPS